MVFGFSSNYLERFVSNHNPPGNGQVRLSRNEKSPRIEKGDGRFIIVINFAFHNDFHKQRLMGKLLRRENICQFDTFVPKLINLEIWYR